MSDKNLTKRKTGRIAKWVNLTPALLAAIIDIAVTVIHQPKAYWNGDLTKANEANPFGASLMANHVSGIFVISGIWIVIITIMGYYLPIRYSRYFLLFAVIAHSFGASTWISNKYGFWLAMALILLNTITYITATDFLMKQKEIRK